MHLLLQLVLPSVFFELPRINKWLTRCRLLLLHDLRLLSLLFPLNLNLLLFLLDFLDLLRWLLLFLYFRDDDSGLRLPLINCLFHCHHYFALILPKEIGIAPRRASIGGVSIIEQGRIIRLLWLRLLWLEKLLLSHNYRLAFLWASFLSHY